MRWKILSSLLLFLPKRNSLNTNYNHSISLMRRNEHISVIRRRLQGCRETTVADIFLKDVSPHCHCIISDLLFFYRPLAT